MRNSPITVDTERAMAAIQPFAMLFRDQEGKVDKSWRSFQREWCSPIITGAKMKQYGGKA